LSVTAVLHRKPRRTNIAGMFLLVPVTVAWCFTNDRAAAGHADVPCVRGIVVEDDEEGNPRVLLGAPTPMAARDRSPETICAARAKWRWLAIAGFPAYFT
jgi:hypothetical protein